MVEMTTFLDELEILVERGIYKDREELVRDAMQSLMRSRPELRRELAIGLYKRGSVSQSRAAEIGGLDIESFKELLREARGERPIAPCLVPLAHSNLRCPLR